jgi:hypothetical protein
MIVERVNFSPVIPDNETTYLNYLEGLIASVDQDATLLLIKNGEGDLTARVVPSEHRVFEEVFKVIKRFHTMLGIQVEFSKSMKVGRNITFKIKFENEQSS